jgi:hypothetical protein
LLLFVEAMADLSTAIELSTNAKNNEKTLSLALTQRGVLNRFLGRIKFFVFHVQS